VFTGDHLCAPARTAITQLVHAAVLQRRTGDGAQIATQ
jgi:hypothetical protein